MIYKTPFYIQNDAVSQFLAAQSTADTREQLAWGGI
jgi:hypothetical protein